MSEIGFIFTLYYIGFGLGGVLFAMPDRLGRRKTLIISGFAHVIMQYIVIFCPNYWVRSISFACMSFWHIKTSVSFVYLFEISETKNKSFSCAAVNFVDSLPLIVGGVFFKYISTNVTTLLIIMSSLHLVSICIISVIMPESPKWLLVTGQKQKAIESFNYIAKFNGNKFRFNENARFIESDLINNSMTLDLSNNKSYADVLKDVSNQMFDNDEHN
mmetsp:Transcript_7059/g.9241  ORF Transcript_7059/g.9241 Transcript_7059/m.9241 type:complete len:216 (+) Transcript_7059:3-650(+)